MDATLQESTSPRGLTANALKWVAICAMIIDHIADGFLPGDSLLYALMRFIGRITGPVMFFMVSEGYRHTRSKNRYTLRLALFAAVSYLPYIYFHYGALPDGDTFLRLNVIWTILVGFLAVRAQHEIAQPVLRVLAIIALGILSLAGDWGLAGFLMMLVFDYFHGSREKQIFAYLLVAGTEGGMFGAVTYPFQMYLYTRIFDRSIYPGALFFVGMILPAILLRRYNGQKGSGGAAAKWLFYLIYPLHFLVLGFIKFGLAAD